MDDFKKMFCKWNMIDTHERIETVITHKTRTGSEKTISQHGEGELGTKSNPQPKIHLH